MAEPGGEYDASDLRARGLEMLPHARQTVQRAAELGVKIAAGSDMRYDNTSPATVVDEVAELMRSGVRPMVALRAATSIAAECLGIDSRTGSVRAGLEADIIVLPANKSSSQVTITMDLTASILAATGATIPATYKFDGLNLLSSWSGRSPAVERQLFWRIKSPHEQRAVRSGRWKLLQDGRNFYLFDVSADPGERHDLTAAHPELVRKLSAALDGWEKDVATPTRLTKGSESRTTGPASFVSGRKPTSAF